MLDEMHMFILGLGSCQCRAMSNCIHRESDAQQHRRLSVHSSQACPAICHMQTTKTLNRITILAQQDARSKIQSVTTVRPAKAAELIMMLFGTLTPMGPRNHVLHGVQIPYAKWKF